MEDMVFWGVEVKPGKPHTLTASEDGPLDRGTLHLSQATLGLDAKASERTVVKCKVGEGPELLLCSLIQGVAESCSLDLLFDHVVTFSVVGPASVHLVGYFMPSEDEEDDSDYEFDDVSEEDGSDEEVSDSEMDDEEIVPSSVTIEELSEEETPSPATLKLLKGKEEQPKGESKAAQKKRKKAEAKAEAEAKAKAKVAKDTKRVVEDDSEDEDGFAKETPPTKKQAVKGDQGSPVAAEPKKKTEKKKRKDKAAAAAAAASPAAPTPSSAAAASNAPTPEAPATKSRDKASKKAKENGVEKAVAAVNGETPNSKKGTPSVKKFPNGLEIQEVSMGKPDAKQAKSGKRVGMIYTGRLKSNGKIFDSNVGKKPFEFRLGVGEVIKGWDVGVNGMRVGDKRKLVIPPAMGYGAKGVSGTIPGNATLEFDVELVHVK